MRPKLTKKLKERLFGLYVGQYVMSDRDDDKRREEVEPMLSDLNSTFLYLRSASNITDNEAILLATNYYQDSPHLWNERLGRQLTSIDENIQVEFVPWLIDHLRSIGIALPFLGYSVEELIKVGWIRIQE